MVAVNFNEADIRAAVQKAIFDSLTDEARDELLRGAIASLMEPDKNAYGRAGESKLVSLFNSAVGEVAREVARKMLGEDETREKIGAMLTDAFDKATTGPAREKLVERIGGAMEAAFRGDRL